MKITVAYSLFAAGLALGLVGGACLGQRFAAAPPSCCAHTEGVPTAVLAPVELSTGARRWLSAVQGAAQWHLDTGPRTRRKDCSGLVGSVLARAGVVVEGNSESLFRAAAAQGRVIEGITAPVPGLLAFFDRTYDANGNGRDDDELTHVAVVVNVLPDDTVVMVHRGSGRIKSLHMNLRTPRTHRHHGRVINDFLRSKSHTAGDGPRLAGELFRGFAVPPLPLTHERLSGVP